MKAKASGPGRELADAFLWASTANSATVTNWCCARRQSPSGRLHTVASSPLGASIVLVRLVCRQRLAAYLARTKSLLPAGLLQFPSCRTSWEALRLTSQPRVRGSLRVLVTSQNNADVNSNWISSFTSNSLPTGWSVREQTFIDTANALFTTTGATVTQLGNTLFNAIGTSVAAALAPSGNNYSVTHLYTIVATGTGAALSTIASYPDPGALPLFAAGLLGLWALGRRRKASPEKVA